ncbi:alpha/beta hydrolase [Chloroflexota bacterium]
MKSLKLIFVVTLGLLTALVAVAGYLAHSLTKVVRVPIREDPLVWGLEYEDVSFPGTVDRLRLRGWYIPAKDSQHCIIMVHGSEQHRADPAINTLGIAKELVGHGYNVLMFDLRGHGESAGSHMSAGYYEQRDLEGAVAYVRGRGISPENIGLLGFSLGAATALLTAAGDEQVRAIVADSCYANPLELVQTKLRRRSRPPTVVVPLVRVMVRLLYGIDFARVRPIDAVSRITPRPILFIHGQADEAVPVEHSLRLFQAAANPRSEVWVVPDAAHVGSYLTRPEEYMERITAFFNRHLR